MVKAAFLYFLLLTATLVSAQSLNREVHTIYVSSISWHTGIVVPAYSMPDSLWPEDHHYPVDAYLEIGWGEADYFPHEGFNLWYALKSAFWPTSSVLHVNPVRQSVERYYTRTKVVRIAVNEEQLKQLIHYLLGEFELDREGKAIPVQAGLYADSYFYKADRSYYFPNNSNVWAARALKRTGFSISPLWYQTTGWVLNQAANFGELVVEDD